MKWDASHTIMFQFLSLKIWDFAVVNSRSSMKFETSDTREDWMNGKAEVKIIHSVSTYFSFSTVKRDVHCSSLVLIQLNGQKIWLSGKHTGT